MYNGRCVNSWQFLCLKWFIIVSVHICICVRNKYDYNIYMYVCVMSIYLWVDCIC